MIFIRLKLGKTFKAKGCYFKKGEWVEVNREDAEYFYSTGRFEVAPSGTKPQNEKPKSLDGIIGIGQSKDNVPTTIPTEKENEEEIDINKIREKYKKENKTETPEVKKEVQDITNKKYIKEKQKAKGDING